MTVTYGVESFATSRAELEALLPLHWEALARDRDDPRFQLKPDWATYQRLEDEGQFYMFVVRVDGRMAGYLLGFIRTQLHYLDSLAFICDIYFVLPAYRRGRIGIDLFKRAEAALRGRGVDKIYLGCKCREELDNSKLFTRLGFEKIEYVFAKVLG